MFSSLFIAGSFVLGVDVKVVNNDAVDLPIDFIPPRIAAICAARRNGKVTPLLLCGLSERVINPLFSSV